MRGGFGMPSSPHPTPLSFPSPSLALYGAGFMQSSDTPQPSADQAPGDFSLSLESDQCAFCHSTGCEPGPVPLLPMRPAAYPSTLTWQHAVPLQQKTQIINTWVKDRDLAAVSPKEDGSVDSDPDQGAGRQGFSLPLSSLKQPSFTG